MNPFVLFANSRRGVLLPDEWVSEKSVVMDKNFAEILSEKHPPKKKNVVITLEAYKSTPVFFRGYYRGSG